MFELHNRAIQAAERFVERRGYEVLGTKWTKDGLAGCIDLVAEDEGTVVFIDVTACDHSEGGFREGNLTREQFEVLAAAWLGENSPEGDISVRFDRIDMIVVSEDRALLRHHISALSDGAVG